MQWRAGSYWSSRSSHPAAIHKIIAAIGSQLPVEAINVNLSEYNDVSQLAKAFELVNQSIARRCVPLVFFDEFDCALEGDAWAWLKSFLPPMEDGTYQRNSVKEAIFVFAGGTSSTFADFSLHARNRNDPRWPDFAAAKGPDFVSRLHGHMDVMGVNPTGADDDLYLIRRAVFLRSRLSMMKMNGRDSRARIDTDVLYALLHAPAYRHGGRSMRIILELCHRNAISGRARFRQLRSSTCTWTERRLWI